MITNLYIVCLQQFLTLVAPDGAIEVNPLFFRKTIYWADPISFLID